LQNYSDNLHADGDRKRLCTELSPERFFVGLDGTCLVRSVRERECDLQCKVQEEFWKWRWLPELDYGCARKHWKPQIM